MTKPSYIVVDCETTGLHPINDRLLGFAIGLPGGHVFWEDARNVSPRAAALLSDPTIAKVNHNLRFDLKFLRRAGIEVAGRALCTLQMFKCLDENAPAGLKELRPGNLEAKAALDRACSAAGARHVGEACALILDNPALYLTSHPLYDAVRNYCMEDVTNTLSLYQELRPKFLALPKATQNYYFGELMPAELAIMEMELRGVSTDGDQWARYLEKTRVAFEAAESQLTANWSEEILQVQLRAQARAQAKLKTDKGKLGVKLPPFLWSSTKQVGELIYDILGYPPQYTDKGNRKVDEAVVRELAIPGLSEEFTLYQGLKKELSTYAEGFREHIAGNGRVYSNFPQLTVTGRFASSDPNMQNIPRGSGLKRCFVPSPDHVFVYADYSQIELRIAAHNSQDPVMLSWFANGIDPHAATARAVFNVPEGTEVTKEQRQAGKALNFALIYDAGPYRLSEMFTDYGLSYTPDECKWFRNRFFDTHHVYRKHLDGIWTQVQKHGSLMAANGRIRRIPDAQLERQIDRKKRLYIGPARDGYNDEIFDLLTRKIAHAKKQAFNFPVQSVGASVTKAALIALQAAGFRTVLTVHDSIVVELPVGEVQRSEEVRRIMEQSYQLSVPITVDLKILRSLDESDHFFTCNMSQVIV